jgi:hypothetical protein
MFPRKLNQSLTTSVVRLGRSVDEWCPAGDIYKEANISERQDAVKQTLDYSFRVGQNLEGLIPKSSQVLETSDIVFGCGSWNGATLLLKIISIKAIVICVPID